jgi:ATP-dependent Lhr-like helicase
MYEYDERPDLRGKGGSLGDEIIREALGNPLARPALPQAAAADFCARLWRELPLWTPQDETGLCEWVRDRVAIPLGPLPAEPASRLAPPDEGGEWGTLLAAMPEELRAALAADPSLGGRILRIRREGASVGALVHREAAEAWKAEGIAQLGPWLRYEGPVSIARIAGVFGVSLPEAEDAADALMEAGELVRDVTVAGGTEAEAGNAALSGIETGDNLVCDRENLEILLRLTRKKRRPPVSERPAALLSPYLAIRQGLIRLKPGPAAGALPWQALAGYAAPAGLWESDFFSARLSGYGPEILDRELAEGRILWYGAGSGRIGFCAPEDLDLVLDAPNPEASNCVGLEGPPGFWDSPRDFWEIKDALGLDIPSCA